MVLSVINISCCVVACPHCNVTAPSHKRTTPAARFVHHNWCHQVRNAGPQACPTARFGYRAYGGRRALAWMGDVAFQFDGSRAPLALHSRASLSRELRPYPPRDSTEAKFLQPLGILFQRHVGSRLEVGHPFVQLIGFDVAPLGGVLRLALLLVTAAGGLLCHVGLDQSLHQRSLGLQFSLVVAKARR